MIALYHSDPDLLEFSAEVRACAPVAGADDLYDVVLSNTAFYPTGGGQPCDAGTLDGFPVEDVSHEGDLAPIVHRVRAPRPLSGVVRGCVDKARRLDFSQQHTGQHMLSHVLCERFDAYSLGLHIGRDDAYVDLAGADAAPMTRALADELEAEVNAWIAQDEPVRCFFPTPEELEALPPRVNGPIHLGLYAHKGINDGLTAADCGKMGYKIITFPVSCLFAQTAAIMSMLKYMKEHETDEGYPGDIMEFADYLKFVNVDHYKELGAKYLRD